MTAASADVTQLANDLTGAGKSVEETTRKLLAEFAQDVADRAQSYAPVKTGALKDSITISWVGPGSVQIGPTVLYGPFQEFGTGERGEFPTGRYKISPKDKKLLSFTVNGKRVYARSVSHPGVRPKKYMRKGFSDALGPFLPALAAAGVASITKGPNS